MFFDSHTKFNNVYYDEDFHQLKNLFKKVTDLFKQIEARHNRFETVQIAKSVFDYCSKRDLTLQYPQEMYDFRFGDSRICIARRKDEHRKDFYTVTCLGWRPSFRHNPFMNDYGYYHSETLDGVFSHFVDIVHDFCLEHSGALF